MRKFAFILTLLFVAGAAFAQTDTQQSSSSQQTQTQSQTPPPDQPKDKKKDKKKKGQDDAINAEEFSDRVTDNVMRDLKDGLEGHMERLVLSVFDDNQMDGYLQFEDQIEQFFNKYDAFRIHYRIIQNSVEGGKGIAVVEMQMEAVPRTGSAPQLRRDQQIRFELERGKKGWKIVDFRPRDFFMP
ncbi:hypothetical protein Acid345_1346 [Candidatus Koribacter versatilis Ellin345]|uniref:SnoaL-like domain-containing protein n=1 Tax=Koribacter versatilis (strain Ellin345) TaxID=204669 RepID=Q1IS02_KORVE|nr:hypothetical protein [Candidatus Koribacter versatilis]ABF40348.1 hypothetical protein Acid345_1346 [Candidatus Koribacter versatilis Ellin345]